MFEKCLLSWFLFFANLYYGDEYKEFLKKCLCRGKSRFVITTVVINGVYKITGEIMATKGEFGDTCTIVAAPVDKNGNPSAYEEGSEKWSHTAVYTDGSGEDAIGDYSITEDKLTATAVHNGNTRESVLTSVLKADGDPDTDEEFLVEGVHTFAVDSPNTVLFEMSGTVSSGSPEPTPEPIPTEPE